MGSLEGHLLPGTFFIVFGFWWTYALFDRYFKILVDSTLTKIPKDFECTASYSRIEGIVKIISSIIGIICEYWTALDNNYEFVNIGNSQHMTMYLFFLINGVVDLSVYNGYPLPNGSDYMSLFIATAVETLLFCFHLHGRTSLDIHVHTLLIISIIASMVSVVIEWKYRNHMLSAFSRALCTLMQGFWFYTVGFILYPPFSSGPIEESHRKQMLITALFCWQIAVIIALMVFIGFCVYYKYRPILKNKNFHNFHANNHLTANHSKDTKLEELNEKQFSIQSIESVNEFKYSAISTSDEEI